MLSLASARAFVTLAGDVTNMEVPHSLRLGHLARCARVILPAIVTLSALSQKAAATPSHVMENHAYSQIIGNPSAPYINNVLVPNGAVLTNSHAVEHPSQPNYLDLFSGANQGVVDDSVPVGLPFSTPNLGALLISKAITFASYSESLPSVGFTGDSFTTVAGQNQYQRKHNPAVNWQAADAPAGNHLAPSLNQPFTAFPTTEVGFANMPTVSIVVPNEQNDMHDGTIATADSWLQNNLEAYRFWAAHNNSILIVTWDEDDFTPTNKIATIFTGQNIRSGMYSESSIERAPGLGVDHYSILRTIENLFGLGTCNPRTDGARNPIVDFIHPPLLNISSRDFVQTGAQVLIAGFIITGNDSKRIMIRGIGPSLGGIGGVLADPTLELHQGNSTIAANDNWKIASDGQSQQTAVQATTLPPPNDNESVILANLNPGPYSAILAGKNGGTGIGVIELYDLGPFANSQLANISTRGFVGTNSNILIGGVIVGGGGAANVIIRAVGPSLPVAGALADPMLELRDGSGVLVQSNDNWKTRASDGASQQAAVEATLLPPPNDAESAIVQNLAPGNYTAIVRGKNNITGIALIEVYNLP
jgi:phosphatidylinositol-3-phosphatase